MTALLLVFGILRLSSQRTPEAAICPLSKERAQNSSRGPLHPSKTNFEFQFNSSLFFTNLRPSTRLPFWTSDMPLSAVGLLRMLAPAPDPTGRYWRPVLCVSMRASAIATDLQARVAPGREHRRTASDAGTRHCKPAANADADARLAKPAARSFTCAGIAGEIGNACTASMERGKREDKKPGGRFRNFFGCFGTFWRTPPFS